MKEAPPRRGFFPWLLELFEKCAPGAFGKASSLNEELTGAKLRQPTVFVAGAEDGVVAMRQKAKAAMDGHVPNLTKKVIIPGAGHWARTGPACRL